VQRGRRRARRTLISAIGAAEPTPDLRRDFDPEFLELLARVKPFSMTTPERLYGLREAVQYIVREGIPGDVVECGVWRGGSSMLIALELDRLADGRRLWMYDTYEGMSEPSEKDGHDVIDRFRTEGRDTRFMAYAALDDVQANIGSTGRPPDTVEYVVGKVEDTIPGRAPETISLLRLDTDWYESTFHELRHLWDRLVPGGVLIIDDYGHWQGARIAVDEFFAELGSRPLFSRLDYTGRMLVKPA
jgi:O-methyltransferase